MYPRVHQAQHSWLGAGEASPQALGAGWVLPSHKDTELLESIQMRAVEMGRGLQGKRCRRAEGPGFVGPRTEEDEGRADGSCRSSWPYSS